jgi:hypothetical protein
LLRFQKNWDDAAARIHYDLCVAKQRNREETVVAYSEAQCTLSSLIAHTLCRALAQLVKGNKKLKKVVESWAQSEVYSPKGMEIYTA